MCNVQSVTLIVASCPHRMTAVAGAVLSYMTAARAELDRGTLDEEIRASVEFGLESATLFYTALMRQIPDEFKGMLEIHRTN